MRNERETSIVPHENEGPKEKEPSFSAVMEHGAELERAVEEGPERLRGESAIKLERIVNASDTTEEERRGMPELEAAARELTAIQGDAERLARKTKGSLGGLLAKAKSYGRGIAGAAALLGAVSFTEGCATMGRAATSGLEQLERQPDRPSAEQVHREAVDAILADKALLAELGPENVKELAAAVDVWDEKKIDAAIHDISGVDPARLEKERMRSVRVLSDAEWAKEKEKDEGFSLTAMAVTENDETKLRASAFTGKEGKIEGREVRHTLTHEKIHGTTTNSENIIMDQQQRFWDAEGVPTDLNEGVTELMATRVMEKIGEKPDDQSYAGGNFAAAYLLERLVGTKDLAADFFEGKTGRIKASLDAKFGKGTGNEILRDRFDPIVKIMYSRPEGLAAALETLKLAAGTGTDLNAWAEQSKRDGVLEDYRFFEKGEGLTITKEIGGKLVVANAAIEGSTRPIPGGRPLRFMAGTTVGGGWKATEHKEAAERVIAAVKKIEGLREKTVKDAGLSPDWQNDPQLRADVDTVVRTSTDALSLDQNFNIVLNISDEMKSIQEEYARETDPAKRKEIEKRASLEAERLVREAMADIQARVAASAK